MNYFLKDPMYLGWRHERISGSEYDNFIDAFVNAVHKKYPQALLHWEDFGRDNARRILQHYRDKICTINGDIQTTAVVTLACILAAVKASGIPFTDHRIAIFGAGSAGIGIADQVYLAFLKNGLTPEQARSRFWLIDKPGLLTEATPAYEFQKPYLRKTADLKDWQLSDPNYVGLYDVVKNAKPTILIGTSALSNAFTEEIIRAMVQHTLRPIIMPLSNPLTNSKLIHTI